MSDLAPQYFDAFCSEYEYAPQQLFCTWHVDKAWKEQVKAKIKSTEYGLCTYKGLRALLVHHDKIIFESKLAEFSEVLINTKETQDFGKYLLDFWVNKKEKWAYCYRTGLGINTNMLCEAFHRVIKYNYLKGKFNMRVDRCLVNLMKFNRNKLFEKLIKMNKKKRSQRVNVIHDRHNSSMKLSFSFVVEIKDLEWHVKSDKDDEQEYIINCLEKCSDDKCELLCTECNICCHIYTCTCPDSLLYNTICKHVHLVHRYCNQKDECAETTEVITIESDGDDEKHEERRLIEKMISNPGVNELSSMKVKTEGVIMELLSCVQNCQSMDLEALQHVHKQIVATKNTFISLQENKSTISLKPTTNPGSWNKKIATQRKFYSTKSKRKSTSTAAKLEKPTCGEIKKFFVGKNANNFTFIRQMEPWTMSFF